MKRSRPGPPDSTPCIDPVASSTFAPYILLMALIATLLAGLAAGTTLAEPALGWSDLYDGGANMTDFGTAVLTDPEGNAIVGGESGDGIDGADWLIRKLERGNHAALWTRRVPFIDTNDMALSGMVWDVNGDILVGGYSRGCVG